MFLGNFGLIMTVITGPLLKRGRMAGGTRAVNSITVIHREPVRQAVGSRSPGLGSVTGRAARPGKQTGVIGRLSMAA